MENNSNSGKKKAQPSDSAPPSTSSESKGGSNVPRSLQKNNQPAWWQFVLPLALYLVGLSYFQPPKPLEKLDTEANSLRAELSNPPSWLGIAIVDQRTYASCYGWFYAGLMGATLVSLAIVSPLFRTLPLRISRWSWIVGAVGAVVWIGICLLDLERKLLGLIGWESVLNLGERTGFNPVDSFEGSPGALAAFLAIRFLGLVVLVPVIEELLLRGLVLRMVVNPHWEEVAFGAGGLTVFFASVVYGVASHPSEMIAAAVWFSMVTWLMMRSRSFLDCVIAHAVTNLLLGIFVLQTGHWELW